MKYLFLDDIRFPYVEEINNNSNMPFYMVSTYYYTKFEPFKTENWVIVRNYTEFVNYIDENGADDLFVAFDHDLGEEHYQQNDNIDYNSYVEKTGYDCVKWLCDYCQENNVKFPEYYIHSMNITGSLNMEAYIKNYKKHIENDKGN